MKNLREMSDTIKCSNACNGVPKIEEREKGTEKNI